MELERTELLARVRRFGPRVILIAAPAGYGKSTFMRQLMRSIPHAICDLHGAASDLDVARRMAAAMAHACGDDARSAIREQLSLPNAFSDWRQFVLSAWPEPSLPQAFVFENAEVLETLPAAFSLLHDLVRDASRTIVICSRLVLALPYGRGLAPPDVMLIGADRLRFRSDELSRLLHDVAPAERVAIERISRGWPVVVMLLSRCIAEAGFAESIATLGELVHEQLYDYLASELIGSLAPAHVDTFLALAAIENARETDLVRAAGPDAGAVLALLRRRVPIAEDSAAGTIQLHPLLAQEARRRYPERCDVLLRRAAAGAAAAGDDLRAAQLYLVAGDKRAAAGAIRDAGLFLLSTPSPAFVEVMSALDGESLSEFPALWCTAMMRRGYSIPPYEWLRTAKHIWTTLPHDAAPELRASVFSTLINANTNIGLCDDARVLLETYERSDAPASDVARSTARLWRAALESFEGDYARLGAYSEELTTVFDASAVTHALYLYDVISPMYQARGDYERAADVLRHASDLAASTLLAIAPLPVVEAAFVAWVAADDAGFERYVATIESMQTPGVIRGYRFFLACARGRAAGVSFGYEKTKTRAQGALIASAGAKDVPDAQAFARIAVATADASGRRYLRILARVALSELVQAERSALLEEAQQLAIPLQSAPMREALARLRAGDRNAGILTPFVARYRALGERKPHIAIRVLAAEVRIEEQPVGLTPTEFGVVAMLARQQRWHPSSELCEELYPELDGEAAENRLYVYVHRVRQRLGRDAILAGPAGYRLAPHVTTDLADADDLLRARAGTDGETGGGPEFERLLRLAPVARDELSARLSRARLPASLQARIEELRRTLLLAAARSAHEQGALAEALRITEELIADDACDGDAHALRIRILLARGDRFSAESAWRSYRTALLAEYGSEPAPFATYAG